MAEGIFRKVTPKTILDMTVDEIAQKMNETIFYDIDGALLESWPTSLGADIINNNNLSALQASRILDNQFLSSGKMTSIMTNTIITILKRTEVMYSLGRLSSILGTTSGQWNIVPTNLNNITDNNDNTASGYGDVLWGIGGPFDAFLTWDIGSIKHFKSLYIKMNMNMAGTGGGVFWHTFLEKSTDNIIWTTIKDYNSQLRFNIDTPVEEILNIDSDVRYFRFHLHADSVTSGNYNFRFNSITSILG